MDSVCEEGAKNEEEERHLPSIGCIRTITVMFSIVACTYVETRAVLSLERDIVVGL